MTDDKSKVGDVDRDRISLEQDYELQYWTSALGVSADRLREAVQAAGPMAEAVRQHLASMPPDRQGN